MSTLAAVSPLLEASGLRVRHGAREVLRGVSLSVSPGELWAVLGPNGAGKSTLLRALLGLAPLHAGAVTLEGKPLQAWGAKSRARTLAWVPQTFDASLGFTGRELALLGRSPHLAALALPSQADAERADAVLEELGLLGLADRSTAALSGGEVRLLLLARALVQAPRVLLLDEPTAFLDLRHQVRTLQAVRRRVEGGLAAVAVLHDVNLAAAYADRVLLLRDGAVLDVGPSREVLSLARLEALFEVPLRSAVGEDGATVFTPRPGG